MMAQEKLALWKSTQAKIFTLLHLIVSIRSEEHGKQSDQNYWDLAGWFWAIFSGLLFLCSQPYHAIHISAGDTRSVLMLNKWQTRKISEYHSDFTA